MLSVTTKLPGLKALSYHSNEMTLDVDITYEIIYAIQRLKRGMAISDDGLACLLNMEETLH